MAGQAEQVPRIGKAAPCLSSPAVVALNVPRVSQEDTGMWRRGVARAELGASPHLPVLCRRARRLPIPSLEQGLLLLLF